MVSTYTPLKIYRIFLFNLVLNKEKIKFESQGLKSHEWKCRILVCLVYLSFRVCCWYVRNDVIHLDMQAICRKAITTTTNIEKKKTEYFLFYYYYYYYCCRWWCCHHGLFHVLATRWISQTTTTGSKLLEYVTQIMNECTARKRRDTSSNSSCEVLSNNRMIK